MLFSKLSRVWSSISALEVRLRNSGKQALNEALPAREMYQLLDAYYFNNGLYDFFTQAMFEAGQWVEALKGLRNPAFRSVEFFPAHIWPGTLPQALPIDTNNLKIVPLLQQIWKWGNWGTKKQIAIRFLARNGDFFIKVVGDKDKTKVYFQLLNPAYVTDFDVDMRGFIVRARTDIPTVIDGKNLVETEYWDKKDNIMKRWFHNKGVSTKLSELGKANIEQEISDFGIDFVPLVHAKFLDVGEKRGVASFLLQLDKIDEVNRKATRLAQMLFRYNKAIWALKANAIDSSGRPLPAPRVGGSTGDPGDGDKLKLGDDQLIRLPGNSSLESLIPSIDYNAHLAAIQADLNELEVDLPELLYYRLKETGNLSGRALQLLLAPAIAKGLEVRGNAETALIRADEMALHIGQVIGLAGFSANEIGTFDNGDFEHTFTARNLIELPEFEKTEQGKLYVDMGVPLKTALRWAENKTDAELEQMEQDKFEEELAEQNTLASALLESQRRIASGEASNGMEQIETAETVPINGNG